MRTEVRLQLSVLACKLGNLWRWLALARRIKNWPLASLQQRHFRGLGLWEAPGPASRRPLETPGAEKWEGALYAEGGASIVLADREIKMEIPA